MKILCLLCSSFEKMVSTDARRILPLMKRLEEMGHEIKFLENPSQKIPKRRILWRSFADPIAYFRFAFSSFLESSFNDYDVIFASKPQMSLLAYLLSKRFSKSFVIDLDDFEKLSRIDIHRHGTSFLVKKATKVIVASKQLYDLHRDLREDVLYFPNTTDIEHFNPDRYTDQKERKITFL